MDKKVMTRFLGVILLGIATLVLPGQSANASRNTSAPSQTCSHLGEFCGGFAGIACCDGLFCKLSGTFPDAGGICVRRH